MKTMIIGLGPDYNYPGKLEEWRGVNNTKFASNHGASLISRALIKEFDGEYVEDISNPIQLSEKYDRCIIAFATHITEKRDVSLYTKFIEKLSIPVYAFSLGVQDYSTNLNQVTTLHKSMKRLLSIVAERSSYIGVRGPYTASILYKEGFKNVLPIGCPTLYYNLQSKLKIKKEDNLKDIAIVYHRTMCKKLWHLMEEHQLIGQDFLDEVVFTDHLKEDKTLIQLEIPNYQQLNHYDQILAGIKNHGIFPTNFKEWFDLIGTKQFVIGARLHGCIAALIQGIPAVMLARDIRVQEIAEFYDIPYYTYDEASTKCLNEIYEKANYGKFEKTFQLRYNNYLSFLSLNGLHHKLEIPTGFQPEYQFTLNDILTDKRITYSSIQAIQEWQTNNERKINSGERAISAIKKVVDRFPFSGIIRSNINS